MPPRLHRAGRRAVSIAALKFATLRRVAPAQTLPRGERGPRLATDLQPRPVPQSTPPEPKPASAGFCVSKNRILGSASELVLGVKREDATARFLRRGFPYGFSRGILCSAYTERYPIPALGLPALRLHAIRRECEKPAGEYREKGAGKDRDPLHPRSNHDP